MTQDRVHFKDIPKTSAFFLDYLHDFSKLEPFFPFPYTLYHFRREIVSSVRLNHRQRLCQVLERQNQSFGAGARTQENLEKLSDSDCLAIVTGQQVGLFTGPAYTIYKALTAVKLAAHYACRGIKTVPIFWMATEDHDIAEVDHCDVVDGESVLSQVHYEGGPEDLQKPVGKVVFLDSIEKVRAQFLGTLPNSEFRQQIDGILAKSYYPGNSFAQAFGQVMSALFANYGLILIDPQDERLKQLVKPVFETVVSRGRQARDMVTERSQRLVAAGYQAQVQMEDEASLLFVEDEGKRKALIRENGLFKIRGQNSTLTPEELLLWARQSPQRMSPNVLLRPVVQDYLLPTLTCVAGPSEIAYLTQAVPLYEFLGGKMPIVFPLSSFSVIEKKTGKVLERYRLDFCDLFQGAEAVMKIIIEKNLDQTLAQKFDEIDQMFDQKLAELGDPLKKIDQTLGEALKTTRQKVQYQLAHLRTKFVHAQARHNDIVTRQIEKALSILYPQKSLQERRLSIFYFLSRYGMDFLAQLYEEIDLSDQDHRLLHV